MISKQTSQRVSGEFGSPAVVAFNLSYICQSCLAESKNSVPTSGTLDPLEEPKLKKHSMSVLVVMLLAMVLYSVGAAATAPDADARCIGTTHGIHTFFGAGLTKLGSEVAAQGTCNGDNQYDYSDIDQRQDGFCIQTQGMTPFGWTGNTVNCANEVWKGTYRLGFTSRIRVCTTNSSASVIVDCSNAGSGTGVTNNGD